MCMYGIFKEHGSKGLTTINLTSSFGATNLEEAITEMENRGYYGAQVFEAAQDDDAKTIGSLVSQGIRFRNPVLTLIS